jgi:hypothetical protein
MAEEQSATFDGSYSEGGDDEDSVEPGNFGLMVPSCHFVASWTFRQNLTCVAPFKHISIVATSGVFIFMDCM